MRLAFAISGKRQTRDAVDVARLVEDRGINEVWITEDYFERGAFAVAGAILAATSTVKVGIGVVNPWTRHPLLTAMEAGALHELAPGRVLLGLGASNSRWMQDQMGIPFDQPLTRLEECVKIVRGALAGDEIRHDGVAGKIEAQLALDPSAVPIILGVKGPRALDLAGRAADGVLLSVLSAPSYVSWARTRIGRDLPHGISSYIAVRCRTQRGTARDDVRAFVATFLGIHGDHAITRVAGLDAPVATDFSDGWRSGNPRVDLVTDEMIDTFVIAGDRDDVAAGLQRYAAARLDTAVLHDQLPDDLGGFLDDVAAAAEDAKVTS